MTQAAPLTSPAALAASAPPPSRGAGPVFPKTVKALLDPRIGQIIALGGLALAGWFFLGFTFSPWQPALFLAATLLTQGAACALLRLPFDPLSPTITALGMTLLFRTESLWLVPLAGAIAMGSKFLIRARGRHLFNPGAFALVVTPILGGALLDAGAWISPGQWGAVGIWATLLAGVGATVAGRAARLDTTLAFLAAWAALLFGRALYMGDPMAIPIWQIQSGAILVFAFHMISDPATTPRKRSGRLLHAVFVAGLGFALQRFWITDIGPILALVLSAPLVPLLDWLQSRPQGRGGALSGVLSRQTREATCASDLPSPEAAAPSRR